MKGLLINEIIGVAKNAAICSGKQFDGADLFFKLAFISDRNIKKMARQLNIKIK